MMWTAGWYSAAAAQYHHLHTVQHSVVENLNNQILALAINKIYNSLHCYPPTGEYFFDRCHTLGLSKMILQQSLYHPVTFLTLKDQRSRLMT